MINVADFIKQRCTTFGTGPLVMSTSELDGFTGFSSAWSEPTEVYYAILEGVNREAGVGTFDGIKTLTRTTVYSTLYEGVFNDTSATPIVLEGTAIVSCTANADAFAKVLNNLATKIVSDTPPTGVEPGQEWTDSTTMIDYTWYEDEDGGQWVSQYSPYSGLTAIYTNYQSATLTADGVSSKDNYITYLDATANDVTITLPNVADAENMPLNIKRIDASLNTATIASSDLIDGLATVSLDENNNLSIISDGTTWRIL